MEQWTFEKFQRPALNADAVSVCQGDSGDCILLETPHGDFEIHLQNNAAPLASVAEWLNTLRDPASAAWPALRNTEIPAEKQAILAQADALSLIVDAIPSAPMAVMTGVIESHVQQGIAALSRHLHDGLPRALVSRVALQYQEALASVLSAARERTAPVSQASADASASNFHLAVLGRQIRYLVRHCPLALAACATVFHRALHGSEPDPLWTAALERWNSGLYGSADVGMYVGCAIVLVSRAAQPQAGRLFTLPADTVFRDESGTNFMLLAENVAIRALRAFGVPKYLTKVQSREALPQWLRKGYFIEEYHVTRRFVEMITPMLAHRLNPDVRRRMYQYFSEEVGHEVFERRTCMSLGISEDELDRAVPLPLYTAYVDVFTQVAADEPIGFIVSIMITEGMLGGGSPILDFLDESERGNRQYAQVARDHDSLNVELNHSSLSRLFMRDVECVPAQAQRGLLEDMLLILELNHRALEGLVEYYETATEVHTGMSATAC